MYLVEAYVPPSPTTFVDAQERARRAGALGAGVRYVRTTLLPGDETMLHIFEAPSAEALGDAGRLAELPFERIVEAIESPDDGESPNPPTGRRLR